MTADESDAVADEGERRGERDELRVSARRDGGAGDRSRGQVMDEEQPQAS